MRPTLLISALLLACLPLLGCRARPAGAFTVTSLDDKTIFTPTFTTAAYLPVDPSTADVYLSDLPAKRLADPNDPLDGAPGAKNTEVAGGSIVQIHLFLIPSAGDTPIDATACNVTIRHIVLSSFRTTGGGAVTPGQTSDGHTSLSSTTPAIGLYGGGGFVLPWQKIGETHISGSIDQATHRLLRSTPGFTDLIGPGSVSGSFNAPRNDALARTIGAKFEALIRKLPPGHALDEPERNAAPKPLKLPATPTGSTPPAAPADATPH